MKKICGKCKETKPYRDFHPERKGKDGLQAYCKMCNRANVKLWQQAHKSTVSSYGHVYIRKDLSRYKYCIRHSKRRNIEFLLTFEQFKTLIHTDCHYCEGMFEKNETGFGIDRKDSAFGYRPDNCLPCCTICNKIKNNFLTVEEAKAAIQAIMQLRNWVKS